MSREIPRGVAAPTARPPLPLCGTGHLDKAQGGTGPAPGAVEEKTAVRDSRSCGKGEVRGGWGAGGAGSPVSTCLRIPHVRCAHGKPPGDPMMPKVIRERCIVFS